MKWLPKPSAELLSLDLPMSNTLILAISIVVAIAKISHSADALQPTEFEWSPSDRQANDLKIRREGSVIHLRTLGDDPYFWFTLPTKQIDNSSVKTRSLVLEFEYFCPDGVRGLQWFVGKPALAENLVDLPALEKSEGWTTYRTHLDETLSQRLIEQGTTEIRFDLGGKAGVELQIRSARVRRETPTEIAAKASAARIRNQKQQLADAIGRYYQRDWPISLTVSLEDRESFALPGDSDSPTVIVRAESKVRASSSTSMRLIRRSPHACVAEPINESELQQSWPVRFDGNLVAEITIPLTDEPLIEVLASRWQLVNWQTSTSPLPANPLSAAVCTTLMPLSPRRSEPRSTETPVAKGLTCITSRLSIDQLRDLGLRHGSVNVLLNGIVQAVSRKETPVQVEDSVGIFDQQWQPQTNRLRSLDQNVSLANNAGVQLAGILLLANRSRQSSPLIHPEARDAGTYAMPNLTTREAVSGYLATIQTLADRYDGVSPQQGKIDHWIIHNEVDYGWQWTNMGEQPMDVFMDHYVRSMRLVDQVVRSFNPQARVFISLTHRWNSQDNRPWKTYPPREMLRWLIRHCEVAGDFPWGVAYHPYPQSLWEADTWNDDIPTDNQDTRLITFKNLQVLDQFMHSEEARMQDGSVRPVICSEQGFHAKEDDPQQLRDQVSALLYAFEKMRLCQSIIAMDYHRPSDHPNEGGLRLGLRGLPTTDNRIGPPKPAWDAYRAINTPEEQNYRKQYRAW